MSSGGAEVIFRQGRGINYFMVFHFTCMHCGDLNSAHKDFLKCTSPSVAYL